VLSNKLIKRRFRLVYLYIHTRSEVSLRIVIVVYIAPSKPSRTYVSLGCWNDKKKRAIADMDKDRNLGGVPYGIRANAIEKCAFAAEAKGYRVFAVQVLKIYVQ